MKTYVYIDGFNLYYGALKGTNLKWLNVKKLAEQLIPPVNVVQRVKYFTARVSGATDPDAPRRQAIYLKALRTIPEVEPHYGNFLAKAIWRPLINLPVANRRIGTAPNHVQLPIGDYPVDGVRPQTLPIGSYPPPGASSQKPFRGPTTMQSCVKFMRWKRKAQT